MRLFGLTAGGKLIPLTVDDDGHLQIDTLSISAGTNLIGRVDARDGDKIWSFTGQVFEQVFTNDATAGTNILIGADVPAGEVWVVEAHSYYNKNTISTAVIIHARIAGILMTLKYSVNPPKNIPITFQTKIIMVEGDNFAVYFYGCSVGDDLRYWYNGYKMQI